MVERRSGFIRTRKAVGFTQESLAEAMNVDRATVRRWECGEAEPQPYRRPKLARLLDISLADLENLLSPTAALQPNGAGFAFRRSADSSPAIAELGDALTDYGLSSSSNPGEPVELRDLKRDLKITFDAYQQSRFTIAASRASALLADATTVARESVSGEVHGILALSYQAAASVLTKCGEPDLAWIAAERGINAAEKANDPAIRGSLVRSVAFSMLATGRLDSAMRLIESGARFLEPEIGKRSTISSVYGMLFLVGAMAAARFGDGGKTADYLAEADRVARLVGHDGNDLWTAFGPTNVAIHRVNTAAELGDADTVLKYPWVLRKFR
jgi:transcriptional regulator with XRE-family HTH domain